MECVEFKITAKSEDTNRMRTLILSALNENEAKKRAVEAGLVEPIEMALEPPKLPTERQLDYIKGVGITIPENATFHDASALLLRYEDNDRSSPNPELIVFADNRKIIFNKYIGKKALYNAVFAALDGVDKIAFFAFCVYRWISDDRRGNLDDHLYREKFYSFANQYIGNPQFLTSMNKYKGEDIRYFGEIVAPDSSAHKGGSTSTIAYKAAAEFVRTEFSINNRRVKHLNKNFSIDKGSETLIEANRLDATNHEGSFIAFLVVISIAAVVVLLATAPTLALILLGIFAILTPIVYYKKRKNK